MNIASKRALACQTASEVVSSASAIPLAIFHSGQLVFAATFDDTFGHRRSKIPFSISAAEAPLHVTFIQSITYQTASEVVVSSAPAIPTAILHDWQLIVGANLLDRRLADSQLGLPFRVIAAISVGVTVERVPRITCQAADAVDDSFLLGRIGEKGQIATGDARDPAMRSSRQTRAN